MSSLHWHHLQQVQFHRLRGSLLSILLVRFERYYFGYFWGFLDCGKIRRSVGQFLQPQDFFLQRQRVVCHAIRSAINSLHCAALFAHYYFSFNAWPTLYDYSLQRQFICLPMHYAMDSISVPTDSAVPCARFHSSSEQLECCSFHSICRSVNVIPAMCCTISCTTIILPLTGQL